MPIKDAGNKLKTSHKLGDNNCKDLTAKIGIQDSFKKKNLQLNKK